MSDDQTTGPRYTRTERGTAGVARSVPPGAAPQADLPLPKEALDERQASIGVRRKTGGPPLREVEDDEEGSARAFREEAPPTDCADPPPEE